QVNSALGQTVIRLQAIESRAAAIESRAAAIESRAAAIESGAVAIDSRAAAIGRAIGEMRNEDNAWKDSHSKLIANLRSELAAASAALPRVAVGRDAMLLAYTEEPIVLRPFDSNPGLLDQAPGNAFNDASGKQKLPCPVAGPDTAVLLIAGQS